MGIGRHDPVLHAPHLFGTFTHSHTHTHTHTHTHISTHTHTNTYTHTHPPTHTHAHTRTRTHTNTHTHTYIHSLKAAYENVKKAQFEIFWYCHHSFILFFCLILSHGATGPPIDFWKFFVGPGTLYFVERLLRYRRATRKCVLLSVTFMKPDVVSLEFAKEGVFKDEYKQGQYLFIQCPFISEFQWHPFTISSAPEEQSVTLHIKVLGEGSWTRQLKNYLAILGKANQAYIPLTRNENSGVVAGKIMGPDGKRLFCIDGPHAAPTQHVKEYQQVMVIGAGIGVTPVAATIKSVVMHHWRTNSGKNFADKAVFAWVCAYNDLDSFKWLFRAVVECQDQVQHLRRTVPEMANKFFQVHIYITSCPKELKPVGSIKAMEGDEDTSFWGRRAADNTIAKTKADFTEIELYKALKCPEKKKTMGDITIYNGRPNWSELFKGVADRLPEGDVGVTFCGNPMIADDLQLACHRFSHQRKGGIFRFHKENF